MVTIEIKSSLTAKGGEIGGYRSGACSLTAKGGEVGGYGGGTCSFIGMYTLWAIFNLVN